MRLVRSAGVGALSGAAMAANCAKDYKDFWDTLDREKFAKMSAEHLSRTALRGYEACTAGDERFTADNFFKKLDTQANSKMLPSDIFKPDGELDSPAAKK